MKVELYHNKEYTTQEELVNLNDQLDQLLQ